MKFLFDFFPILLFAIAYYLNGIYAATAALMVGSALQVSWSWLRHRQVENVHLFTLVTVVLLGGATLLLKDDRFIMWKPTAVYWMLATGFLVSQFWGEQTLTERLMGKLINVPREIWLRLNLTWFLFSVLIGFVNLYVAFYYAPELAPKQRLDIWFNFKVYGILSLTFVFVIAQAFYLARHVVEEPERQPEEQPKEE